MFFTGMGIHDAKAATIADITNTAKAYIGAPINMEERILKQVLIAQHIHN